MTRLSTALPEHGCNADPQTFREEVTELFRQMYPSWTQDDLACEPREAVKFCDMIRERFGPKLPDSLSMKTLFNYRRRGFAGRLSAAVGS
jgi:hypothetical protein